MEQEPLVKVQSNTSYSSSPQRHKSTNYNAVEVLTDDTRILDSFSDNFASRTSCYEKAYLCALNYALKSKRPLQDEVAQAEAIFPDDLENPLHDLGKGQDLSTPLDLIVSQDKGRFSLELGANKKKLWMPFLFFLVLLLPTGRVFYFLDERARLFTALCCLPILFAFIWWHFHQRKYYGARVMRLKDELLSVHQGAKETDSMILKDILQITAHESGVFFFSRERALHFPCTELDTNLWIRQEVQRKMSEKT